MRTMSGEREERSAVAPRASLCAERSGVAESNGWLDERLDPSTAGASALRAGWLWQVFAIARMARSYSLQATGAASLVSVVAGDSTCG